jgi:RNA recognition motif-containing protein
MAVEQTIYVSNIRYTTESRTLGLEFGKFGAIARVRIIAGFNGRERVSRGFGFIEFKTAEAYEAALSGAAAIVVDGRRLVVRPPRPRKRDTAFVLGIPKGTTPGDLTAAFASYHPTNARIIRETDGARTKGFAFVTFASEDDQARAVGTTGTGSA